MEVAERIEASILRGEHASGERLPAERHLAAAHGVNRHTAARALNYLQDKGMIYRVRGSGSFVRPARLDYRIAPKTSFAESVSRLGLRASYRMLSVREVRARGVAAAELGLSEGDPLVALERVSYAGEVPLVYGAKHFPGLLFPGRREALADKSVSLWSLLRAHYGVSLRRARSVFEVEPADGDAAHHLGIHTGAPLLRVESLDTLEDGTPAGWGISHFRADATRIRVEVQHEERLDA